MHNTSPSRIDLVPYSHQTPGLSWLKSNESKNWASIVSRYYNLQRLFLPINTPLPSPYGMRFAPIQEEAPSLVRAEAAPLEPAPLEAATLEAATLEAATLGAVLLDPMGRAAAEGYLKSKMYWDPLQHSLLRDLKMAGASALIRAHVNDPSKVDEIRKIITRENLNLTLHKSRINKFVEFTSDEQAAYSRLKQVKRNIAFKRSELRELSASVSSSRSDLREINLEVVTRRAESVKLYEKIRLGDELNALCEESNKLSADMNEILAEERNAYLKDINEAKARISGIPSSGHSSPKITAEVLRPISVGPYHDKKHSYPDSRKAISTKTITNVVKKETIGKDIVFREPYAPRQSFADSLRSAPKQKLMTKATIVKDKKIAESLTQKPLTDYELAEL